MADPISTPPITVSHAGRPAFGMVPIAVCGLPAPIAHVYLGLATYADGDHVCHPSLPALAERLGVDRRTLMRRLAALEEYGFVRRTPGGGRGKRTHYELLGWENGGTDAPVRKGGAGGTQTGASVSDKQGHYEHETGAQTPPEHTKGTNQEEQTKEQTSDDDDRDVASLSLLFHRHLESVSATAGRRANPAGKAWRAPFRLMIDREGIPAEEIVDMIRWLGTADGGRFWAGVVLSPAKLRHQWPKLELARRRHPAGSSDARGRHERNQAMLEAARESLRRQREGVVE